jgi:hypothetical protein
MRTSLPRVLRIVIVAAAAWLAYVVLDSVGLGWLFLPIGLLLTLAVALIRYRLARRRTSSSAREERWMVAALDEERRPKAIVEASEALSSLGPVSERNRAEHAHLTVAYAELLDADGQEDLADEVLAKVAIEELPLLERSYVCHAMAAHALRMGNVEQAMEALERAPVRCGVAALDLRLELIRAAIELEQDVANASRALEASMHVRRQARGDEGLVMEARVLRAMAMDASGNRSDAVDILRSLGPGVIAMLQCLGQPRLRSLAEEAARGQQA